MSEHCFRSISNGTWNYRQGDAKVRRSPFELDPARRMIAWLLLPSSPASTPAPTGRALARAEEDFLIRERQRRPNNAPAPASRSWNDVLAAEIGASRLSSSPVHRGNRVAFNSIETTGPGATPGPALPLQPMWRRPCSDGRGADERRSSTSRSFLRAKASNVARAVSGSIRSMSAALQALRATEWAGLRCEGGQSSNSHRPPSPCRSPPASQGPPEL